MSHGPRRIRSSELNFEAILNFSPSPKVVISVPDRGVAEQCGNHPVTEPRFSVQPHLLPNTLDCLRRAIGLAGAYRLTDAGCKKDFNKVRKATG